MGTDVPKSGNQAGAPARTASDESLALLAAGLSLAVGIAHATVMPEYLSEWWGYGFFFMMAALTQITYGLLLFFRPWNYDENGGMSERPGAIASRVYLAGAMGNIAIVILYIVTRSIGIPLFGPNAGTVEPLSPLSVAVTLAEGVLAFLLMRLARRAAPLEAGEVDWEVNR